MPIHNPPGDPAKRWVYYVVVKNHPQNIYARFLLTATALAHAEAAVLESVGPAWTACHARMVCSTTDDPFFNEL
jgi:hypothetical protein